VVRNQLMRNLIEPYTGHGTVLVENPNHAVHITVMTLVPSAANIDAYSMPMTPARY
jgi:hypothetical protein